MSLEARASTVTSSPCARHASTMWLPRKPVAPVTKARTLEAPGAGLHSRPTAELAWFEELPPCCAKEKCVRHDRGHGVPGTFSGGERGEELEAVHSDAQEDVDPPDGEQS